MPPKPPPGPRPTRNGAPPDQTPASPPPTAPPEQPGLDNLLEEAEAVRGLLQDASVRLGRLLGALKQHRRQDRAVQAALASLRQLGRLGS
jgi:hypothetical protein